MLQAFFEQDRTVCPFPLLHENLPFDAKVLCFYYTPKPYALQQGTDSGVLPGVNPLWISCGQYVDIYLVAVDKYRECPALCVRLCAFCVRSVFCSGTVDSRQALARLASGRS